MSVVWLFSFLADSAFMLLYFRRATYNERQQRTWLKPFFILASLPLYLNTTLLAIPYAAVRMAFRAVLYFLWCFISEGIPWRPSAYASLFWTAVYTLFQNLFFGPIIGAYFLEDIVIFESDLYNQAALSSLSVLLRLVYFGAIAKLLPLEGMGGVALRDVFLAGSICLLSAYIKSTAAPLLPVFNTSPTQFSMYYIMLHLAMQLVLVAVELVRRKTVEGASLSIQNTVAYSLLESIKDHQAREESIRTLRHDLKNHVMAIELLLDQGRTQELKSYLQTMRSSADSPSSSFRTGNELVDGLLMRKLGPAAGENIAVRVSLDMSSAGFIAPFDMCVLMGNVLDNALEACQNVPVQEQRFINLTGDRSANCQLIRLENSYTGHRTTPGELLKTTKQNKSLHGFGLRNVKRVLDKYGGTMAITAEGGVFTLNMLLPLPEGIPAQQDE